MIVLDTNVVSELMRAEPAPAVLAWIGNHSPGTLMTTAVSVAEIRFGLARLPSGRRARHLSLVAEEIFDRFSAQVLPFDAGSAARCGALAAERERDGRPIAALDAQIAAICLDRGASLATRNVRDFANTGVTLIDPWRP